MKISTLASAVLAAFITLSAPAQNDNIDKITRQLQSVYPDLKSSDIGNLNIDASHVSSLSGVEHLYLNQVVNGIRIKNSTLNASFNSENELVNLKGKPIKNISSRAEGADPKISLEQAIEGIKSKLGIQGSVFVKRRDGNEYAMLIDAGNYRHETTAELVYWFTPEEELKLAWNFNIDLPDETHWFDFIVSAQSGEEMDRIDWQVSCMHSGAHSSHAEGCARPKDEAQSATAKRTTLDGSSYNVFPFPVESPLHGTRDVLTEPALPTASPFGWHDNNGIPGADFTITRGNNVYSYEDTGDNNFPGSSPDGGEELNFDFGLDLGDEPSAYQDAAITNLFYANNVIHDVLYVYGFDEASGNFQDNNYDNGGFAGDEVRAEAQDGGGLNNANMATPGDGSNPRMQMYLWDTDSESSSFSVNSPSSIQGVYPCSATSTFGPSFPDGGLTGDIVLAIDDDSPVNNACSDLVNAAEVDGKIVLLYRGGCTFVDKVLIAQEAGAVGVIIVNNIIGEDAFTPEGASTEVTIPSLMISFETFQTLNGVLNDDTDVNVTIGNNGVSTTKDGSFDNGIIIHEYVHGLTNRLTGGGNFTGCLSGDEQMGEGWSDYYGIMLTANLNLSNPVYRPMGTFASGDPIDGNGIRPVPYDTSFAVNDYTYADVSSAALSVPHGVGFVWGTMLWDMTWALIDTYGYDEDLINGEAGNNIALQLVTEALKLQPCGPGFVDGRDAILLADELLYDGANQCLIWKAFARRGLGVSADQGSPLSRADGVAAFDIPPACQDVFTTPTASFSASNSESCTGVVQFLDESVDVPQEWFWDFGDGNTSEEQNPTHQYAAEGIYSVSLTVSNTLGEDELILTDLVEYVSPDMPEAEGADGCSGESVVLNASSPDGNNIRWLNEDFDEVGLGDNLEIILGDESENYYAQNYSELPISDFVGPEDVDFGTGGIHGTDFIGTVDFQVFEPLRIESAFVVSGATGTRTVSLYPNASAEGMPIDAVTIDIDFTGEGRVDLGFEILEAGTYSIGLNQANLYRNNGGADYPYEFGEVMTIIGSSAGADFYYYFYDLEVTTLGCVSESAEVIVEVTGTADFTYEENDLDVSFFDASAEASTWLWDFGDGGSSTEQNPTHNYEAPGIYLVSLTIDGECSTTVEVPVGTTSTDNIGAADGFAIYPNPTSAVAFLENKTFGSERLIIRLHDVSGKEVFFRDFTGERLELNLDRLNSGIYFLSVAKRDSNGILFRDKLTIAE